MSAPSRNTQRGLTALERGRPAPGGTPLQDDLLQRLAALGGALHLHAPDDADDYTGAAITLGATTLLGTLEEGSSAVDTLWLDDCLCATHTQGVITYGGPLAAALDGTREAETLGWDTLERGLATLGLTVTPRGLEIEATDERFTTSGCRGVTVHRPGQPDVHGRLWWEIPDSCDCYVTLTYGPAVIAHGTIYPGVEEAGDCGNQFGLGERRQWAGGMVPRDTAPAPTSP